MAATKTSFTTFTQTDDWTAEAAIMRGDQKVGKIVREKREDFRRSTRVGAMRVYSYDVTIHTPSEEAAERVYDKLNEDPRIASFMPERYGSARKALSVAKRYAREAVALAWS